MRARYFHATSVDQMRSIAREVASLPASRAHPVEVVVREPRREKSAEQRGLWHAMLAEMAAESGHTPLEMKEVVKREYYGERKITLPTGHVAYVVPSSEEEDQAGYSRLIEFTIRFAAENGMAVSRPTN